MKIENKAKYVYLVSKTKMFPCPLEHTPNLCHVKLPTSVLFLPHSHGISTLAGMHLQFSMSSGKAVTWKWDLAL